MVQLGASLKQRTTVSLKLAKLRETSASRRRVSVCEASRYQRVPTQLPWRLKRSMGGSDAKKTKSLKKERERQTQLLAAPFKS